MATRLTTNCDFAEVFHQGIRAQQRINASLLLIEAVRVRVSPSYLYDYCAHACLYTCLHVQLSGGFIFLSRKTHWHGWLLCALRRLPVHLGNAFLAI